MAIQPLSSGVLVRKDPPRTETESGIALFPGNSSVGLSHPRNSTLEYATVLDVGPGRVTEHGQYLMMHVTQGDRVLLKPHSGYMVDPNDPLLYLVEDHQIAATEV